MEVFRGRMFASRCAAGIDEISIEAFDRDLKDNLYKLWNRLSSGSYTGWGDLPAVNHNCSPTDRWVYYCVKRILFKWLNRKSQRRAYTWPAYTQALAYIGWPPVRIRKALNPCRRTEAY